MPTKNKNTFTVPVTPPPSVVIDQYGFVTKINDRLVEDFTKQELATLCAYFFIESRKGGIK